MTIFPETKALDLTTRFRKDADAFYVEAKRSTVSGVAQIPYWVYGMIVVLGWNEAMMVLFNPLYFAMLLVLGATAYVMLQLGLVGPALQVGRTIVNEASIFAFTIPFNADSEAFLCRFTDKQSTSYGNTSRNRSRPSRCVPSHTGWRTRSPSCDATSRGTARTRGSSPPSEVARDDVPRVGVEARAAV